MPSINTARELCTALISGEIKCEEAAQSMLDKILKNNQRINAYISVSPNETLRQARESDAILKRYGPRSALHGAPIAIKDIISVAGYPLTAGSKILGQEEAKRDAECVSESKRAGLIILGKTNLHEFASRANRAKSTFWTYTQSVEYGLYRRRIKQWLSGSCLGWARRSRFGD